MTIVTAVDLAQRLEDLRAESAAAALEGLEYPAYATDLATEIEATQHAFVGVAVTEIATLRGELSGRPQG